MRLPPPTLFPYTTLFRSAVKQLGQVAGHVRIPRMGVDEVESFGGGGHRQIGGEDLQRGVGRSETGVAFVECFDGDRKSTRLNSSHVSISYAVFCLKKNNT